MKVGDIVYFKSVCTARYGKEGGTYEYYFKPGDRYLIKEYSNKWVTTGSVRNLEDGTSHFIHNWDEVVTQDQWRELQLEKLI